MTTGRARTLRSGASPFGSALRIWRNQRGLSLRALGERTGIDHSKLGKIERGERPASSEQVTHCERALQTGGKLVDAWYRETGVMRPRELPAAPTVLVGRGRHLAELDAALAARAPDAPPLMVLDGPAGVGKTALALRWAHKIAHTFPDGQLYADLKGFSPEEQKADTPARVLAGFCTALGATEIPDDLEGRASLFRSLVAGTRILILLDNVANAEQARPLLPGSPSCCVVVTSRRVLSGLAVAHDGRRISVAPLTEPDSIQLVTTMIGGRRAEQEPAAVAELTRLCGHLPLALRVAAELAFIHPRRQLAALVQDLSNEDERLDRLDTDDTTAPRHVFSWTYRDLSEPAARMFRLLGLHRGPSLSEPAVAALTGTTMKETRASLRQLRGVNLLDIDSPDSPDTARLHDLLHDYAHELVANDPPDVRQAAIHRLALWYLHTIRVAGQTLTPRSDTPFDLPSLPENVTPLRFPTTPAAMDWCDREQPNFAIVARLAVQNGRPDIAWKIAIALWDYLVARQPWDVWLDMHAIGQEAAENAGNELGVAWVTAHWGEALRRRGQLTEAHQHYERALEIQQRVGDRHGQAWTTLGFAYLALDRHQLDRAHSHAQQAQEQFVQLNNRAGHAGALLITGQVLARRDQHIDGLAVLQRGLDLLNSGDSTETRGRILGAIAEIHLDHGDFGAALNALDRAAEEHAAIDDQSSEAAVRRHAGDLRHRLNRLQETKNDWERAHHLYALLGEHQAATTLSERLGRLDEQMTTCA